MKGSLFRLDLIIATLALLASASASIATIVQTRVVANQLSAAVWPYLNFTTTESPKSFLVTLDNDGLGPALIRSASLDIDGRKGRRLRDALAVIKAASGRSKGALNLVSYAEFGAGTVIRPATNFFVLRVDGAHAPQIASAVKTRSVLSICYCSILQKCWIVKLGNDAPPSEVVACDSASPSLKY